jgi:hypothetical protein
VPSYRLAKGTRLETGYRHFGIACCNSEFRRDNQLLSAAWFCCGAGSGRGKCVFYDAPSVALGVIRWAAWPGILAATSRQAMFDQGPDDWECAAVDGAHCGVGNDSISAGNCCIYRGQVFRKMKKKQLIGAAVAAVLVLLAAAYRWGPGSAPGGQAPVVTLSEGKFGEFEKAFDAEADVPRLVLLLSPT